MNKINLFLLILILNISVFSFTPEFNFVPDDVIHKAIGNYIMQNLNALAKIGDMPEGLKITEWIRTPVYDKNGNIIFYEEVGYFGKDQLPENAYEILKEKIRDLIRENYMNYMWGGIPFYDSEIGKFIREQIFNKQAWFNQLNLYSEVVSPYYEGYPIQSIFASFGIRSLEELAVCEYFLWKTYGNERSWRPLKLIYIEECSDNYKWLYEIDGKEYVMLTWKNAPEGKNWIKPLDEVTVGTREKYYFEVEPKERTIDEYINNCKIWWEKYESGSLWEDNNTK
jgi:hypothetical protein